MLTGEGSSFPRRSALFLLARDHFPVQSVRMDPFGNEMPHSKFAVNMSLIWWYEVLA